MKHPLAKQWNGPLEEDAGHPPGRLLETMERHTREPQSWLSEGKTGKTDLVAARYLPIKELGRGMEGTVYLVEDIKLGGRLRALKRYHPSVGAFAAKERDMLIQIRHPFIPELTDWIPPDAANHTGAIVTNYVAGTPLDNLFRGAGNEMSEGAVLGLAIQVCLLLEYLHGLKPQPVIYRDLKPSNLLIDARGEVHLIDFGSSRLYKPWGLLDTEQLGTVGFAAPEQFELRQSDERTDLYALGALMYYLLNGGRLHYFRPAGTPWVMPVRPSLQKIINQLLEPEPEARFQSAETVRMALLGELKGCSSGAGCGLFSGRSVYLPTRSCVYLSDGQVPTGPGVHLSDGRIPVAIGRAYNSRAGCIPSDKAAAADERKKGANG